MGKNRLLIGSASLLVCFWLCEARADQQSAFEALQSGRVAEAVAEYKRLAEVGEPEAQVDLGYLYENGRGIERNYLEALKWYLKAAEQGNPYGQFAAGVFYDLGRGISRDDNEAVKWYRKAAVQGDDKAQFNLACMYAEGRGVQKSDKQAYFWFSLAARSGEKVALKKRDQTGRHLKAVDREAVDRRLERGNVPRPRRHWRKPMGLLV